jgi:hypothetical protein
MGLARLEGSTTSARAPVRSSRAATGTIAGERLDLLDGLEAIHLPIGASSLALTCEQRA